MVRTFQRNLDQRRGSGDMGEGDSPCIHVACRKALKNWPAVSACQAAVENTVFFFFLPCSYLIYISHEWSMNPRMRKQSQTPLYWCVSHNLLSWEVFLSVLKVCCSMHAFVLSVMLPTPWMRKVRWGQGSFLLVQGLTGSSARAFSWLF